MSSHKLLTLALIMIMFLAIGSQVTAGEKFFQLSLITPYQVQPESDVIKGIRFNLLYGRQASVTGFDFGVVNATYLGTTKGYQLGFVNYNEDSFLGWQKGIVNVTMKDFEGFQLGIVNYAQNGSGFQLGFVNYAYKMHGLQIGLVNIIKQGGQFPIFPIINWSF